MKEVQLDLRSLPPYGYNAGRGDSHQIAHAKSLILQAENPALLVQEGVARNRALAETVKFAELLGAPVSNLDGGRQFSGQASSVPWGISTIRPAHKW